ncbi:unnamed protein product [Linum trigynum]|uniref:Uncharacterized protein n=1 Tax=Linum trigynum TaxID=586398 RepID=A0AAV2DW68_9ROSI
MEVADLVGDDGEIPECGGGGRLGWRSGRWRSQRHCGGRCRGRRRGYWRKGDLGGDLGVAGFWERHIFRVAADLGAVIWVAANLGSDEFGRRL